MLKARTRSFWTICAFSVKAVGLLSLAMQVKSHLQSSSKKVYSLNYDDGKADQQFSS